MINFVKSMMLLSSLCFAITFEVQNHSATINMDSLVFSNPFSGGINYARISWYDWDSDNDIDLFLLDEDLHFRYFQNDGDVNSHNFILADHPLNELSGINWFHLDDLNSDDQTSHKGAKEMKRMIKQLDEIFIPSIRKRIEKN